MSDPTSDRPALGVAAIGYSFMGKAHSHAWRNLGAYYPGLSPVRQQVLVGRDPAQVKEAADRYGWAEAASDWREVVTRPDVDVVDVCTPGQTHCEIAIAALEAGKHVLVEKPLANSVEEGERMLRAAEKAAAGGVRAMVGFNYRRVPALALARQLIGSGDLGEVREARIAYLQDWLTDPAAPMTWRLRREQAGSGALGDLGSHAVDQVRHLLGDDVVAATGALRTFVPERSGPDGREPVTVDDAAWARLETGTGAVVSLEVSRVAAGRKNAFTIEVYGSHGSLAFDLERLNELVVDTGDGARRVLVTEADHPYLGAWWPPGHILGWDSTFVSQAADLVAAIDEGRDPVPGFADGLAVQRVLDAIERSSEQDGARVAVTEG